MLTRYGLPVPLWNAVAWLAERVARGAEEIERRCRTCPDCGRSRWYGRACK